MKRKVNAVHNGENTARHREKLQIYLMQSPKWGHDCRISCFLFMPQLMNSRFFFLLSLILGHTWVLPMWAQVGCPAVCAGADATLTCATTCVNLNGLFFNTGQTNTYTVQNIAYSPNSFTTGTPILFNIDDTWSNSICKVAPILFRG